MPLTFRRRLRRARRLCRRRRMECLFLFNLRRRSEACLSRMDGERTNEGRKEGRKEGGKEGMDCGWQLAAVEGPGHEV